MIKILKTLYFILLIPICFICILIYVIPYFLYCFCIEIILQVKLKYKCFKEDFINIWSNRND